MTTISIRPIGQEAPVITGEVVHENENYRQIKLAPNAGFNLFHKDEWELVPVPFVFPTAFGARITGTSKYGQRWQLVYEGYGTWRSSNAFQWNADDITDMLTDLRVVDADPDWGDE